MSEWIPITGMFLWTAAMAVPVLLMWIDDRREKAQKDLEKNPARAITSGE